MKPAEIGWLDDLETLFTKELNEQATTKEALLGWLGANWAELCSDAITQAEAIVDWRDFKKALYLERHGRFMGKERMERYGALLMPKTLFRLTVAALRLKVPSGAVYRRLVDLGMITEENGKIVWKNEHRR